MGGMESLHAPPSPPPPGGELSDPPAAGGTDAPACSRDATALLPERGWHVVRDFSGLSGCTVRCLRHAASGAQLVRKTVPHPGYNPRLQHQLLKQARFQARWSVAAPRVLGVARLSDGRLCFDMEYIPGTTLAEQFAFLPLPDLRSLVRALCAIIPLRSSGSARCAAQCTAKLTSLHRTLPAAAELSAALALLQDFDWTQVPCTPCHGDLTLENILVTPEGRLCLIDFLDTCCRSWMTDVAKLLQDLELHWSFRHQFLTPALRRRLLAARLELLAAVEERPHGSHELLAIYHLLLLNLLRIVPYAADEVTRAFLSRTIPQVCAQLRRLRGGHALP